MASLLIIGSNLALGAPVLFFEGLGALIGLAGALICAKASSGDDDDEDEANSSRSRAMMGNIIAFLASVSTAFYLIVAKNLRPKVDLFLFMFQIFTLASIFLFIYMQQSGQECELSFHPEIGFFGWMNPQLDRLPLELYMAIICNGVGTTGYIAIMKYFDPVVVSMVMLMEPVIAAFMGVAAGVSTLPGWVTWAGDAVVTVGSLMVISSGAKKTESIDATCALHTLEGDDNIEGRKSNASFPKSPMPMKSPLITKSPMIMNNRGGVVKSPMLINSRGGLAKSPLLMKSPLIRTDERGFTRSPATMKSPRVMKSPHRGKNITGNITRKIKRDVIMDGDMEIGSVKGRPRSVSMGGEGHRVIWN